MDCQDWTSWIIAGVALLGFISTIVAFVMRIDSKVSVLKEAHTERLRDCERRLEILEELFRVIHSSLSSLEARQEVMLERLENLTEENKTK